MTLISIRERGITSSGPVVAIDGQEYPIPKIASPFDEGAEAQLEWYFEEHLRFPFTHQVRAQEAATSIGHYGETLFEQIFGDRRAYGRYQTALQSGIASFAFEIVGSLEFQRLHWEALKDPDLPQPFALHAPFVRRNLMPRIVNANVQLSPTINVLVVTARPGAGRDVGYRTISLPLVAALRQAGMPVTVNILRPGSYAALVAHLEAMQDNQGAGYYHVIHFDVHGALLTFSQFDALEKKLETSRYTFQPQRYGRGKLAPYPGVKAFLFLESGAPGLADPVEATELAQLLLTHQIPIAILNACQSGKQVGATETSLGSQLMSAGMQMVLAMSYTMTVSAAVIMMARLYQQLFQSGDLVTTILDVRLELYNRKTRQAYYNQTVELEDWLLPVVYQNQPQILTTRPFTEAEQKVYYERQATRYREPHVTYGFVGRDLDILHIEQRLLRQENGRDQNLLLVRGMGGAGKSTLLHHLAAWWQTTELVDRVFYFGYDERAYTLHQLLDAIGHQLLNRTIPAGAVVSREFAAFQAMQPRVQATLLAQKLRSERHLLILDNLESITGSNLAILNTLPPADQRALHGFLRELAGGKTLVLLGSRGPESWLAPGTFDTNVYELPGLDPEAASTLADRVLARNNAIGYRTDPAMQQDLQRLITLLDGHPLALEVVLANLAKQTPAQVLAALQSGDVTLDPAYNTNYEPRTQSILASINYAHSNLAPDSQQLLLCLAPFTGVINREWLSQYTAQLSNQPALVHLPFDRWNGVVDEAMNWGLLTPDTQLPMYLRVQPSLPYFLRTRLQGQDDTRNAIDQAFCKHCNELGNALHDLLQSNDAHQRQLGTILVKYEYENLYRSINLALQNHLPFYGSYLPLHSYLNITQDPQRVLNITQTILGAQEQYSTEQLAGDVGRDFYLVYIHLATAYQNLREYSLARAVYEQSFQILENLQAVTNEARANYRAVMYHQLGIVAQEQRQWAQAERYYQEALALKIEFNDRYSQANTYHQLGMVAQEQREWVQAEAFYQHALSLYIEFDERYSQAHVYHSLGRVAQAEHQWAEAEAHYQQALALKIEYNDRYSQANTYHSLGRLAQEQRQWAEAEAHYQQALLIWAIC
jgi:tetratricopeptide (TPR) repeat protein